MTIDRGSGRTLSLWMADIELPKLTSLRENAEADVCVIGAGMAGLSVAYSLASEGKSVIVLEDGATIGAGETARTTAHLVNAFDDRYYLVEQLHGSEGARLTAESHTAAIDEIERIAKAESIDCDFQRLPGYLFVPPGDPVDELDRELEACHAAGLVDVSWVDRAPLEGFETGRCLRFPRQAQLHPLRYLAGLATAITSLKSRIFTGTHAASIEGGKTGERGRVKTEDGIVVTARDLVVATNTPVQDLLTIHTKQYPYRTYVIAARVPRGSVEPALQEKEGEDPHAKLAAWTKERFPMMKDVVYRWSGQVMEPMDVLAYIGRNPGDDNVWVVTGDSGNGMTHGAIAGMLLRDLILGRDNPWAKLYEPSRKSIRAALEFTRENVNMAAQYTRWLTAGDVKDESEIPRGSGGVIREGLKKFAVYRDKNGAVHRMSATCPHLGAIVGWNAKEGTWDCPAHGSRFDSCGKVINGPANSDLEAFKEEASIRSKGPDAPS